VDYAGGELYATPPVLALMTASISGGVTDYVLPNDMIPAYNLPTMGQPFAIGVPRRGW
jgi:hypothetical protein